MDVKMRLALIRGRMRGFLEFGLFEDGAAEARELRRIRTEITRAIVDLEAAPSDEVPAEPGAVLPWLVTDPSVRESRGRAEPGAGVTL